MDLALRERAEERALARVGVADDGEHRNVASVASAPPRFALLAQLRELALQAAEAVARAPAVDLELRLAGSAAADAAGQPRQGDVGPLGEAGQPVAQLRQLDL